MSCILKIRSIREDVSANERKLIDYILENVPLLRDYSSQQLANAVGISQSSVVKFCQKLGYKGYPDLKLAIYEDFAVNLTPNGISAIQHFENKKLNTISDQLLKGKIDAVSATIQHNHEDDFIRASDAIDKAKKIQVFGSGISSFVAEHFVVGLINLGKVAFASNDPVYRTQFLETLNNKDLIILLNESEKFRLDNKLLTELRDKGISILHIGRYSPQTNQHVSDIYITTVANDDTYDELGVSSRSAQQHIIDILLSLASQR
ncbi:MAG: MurR/RpiR family transcriptional regulator [Gammaproteobacteria bacterium]|nr:MurR/RpiR family transcriptional regulator [Gammaproteobacteria bacterium]MDH5631028.1 MurR/RpiR family transcriptional regulator [Gammaproteobacteria bacterium]